MKPLKDEYCQEIHEGVIESLHVCYIEDREISPYSFLSVWARATTSKGDLILVIIEIISKRANGDGKGGGSDL